MVSSSRSCVSSRTSTSALTVALVTLLALSLALPVGLAGSAAADEECEDIDLETTYDEFRFDNSTVSEFDSSGEASVEKQNTKVSLDADEAFVRLSVENANTYCAEFTVEMSDDVVTAATLGSVEGVDESINADWRAVHDFDTEQTYTEVTVTVPPETDVTFAPSQLRVKSLSWTSDLEASGFVDNIRNFIGFGSPPLEERTHTITGNVSEQVTIPLTHPDDAEESIDDWRATYTVLDDDDGSTHILSEDSGNAVFYRSLDDGEAVEIVFNEPAEVEFIAEPTFRDKVRWEIESFLSSLSDILPIWITPMLLATIPVAANRRRNEVRP